MDALRDHLPLFRKCTECFRFLRLTLHTLTTSPSCRSSDVDTWISSDSACDSADYNYHPSWNLTELKYIILFGKHYSYSVNFLSTTLLLDSVTITENGDHSFYVIGN